MGRSGRRTQPSAARHPHPRPWPWGLGRCGQRGYGAEGGVAVVGVSRRAPKSQKHDEEAVRSPTGCLSTDAPAPPTHRNTPCTHPPSPQPPAPPSPPSKSICAGGRTAAGCPGVSHYPSPPSLLPHPPTSSMHPLPTHPPTHPPQHPHKTGKAAARQEWRGAWQ